MHSFEVTGIAGSPQADWRGPTRGAGVVRSVIGTTTGSRTTYRGGSGRGQSSRVPPTVAGMSIREGSEVSWSWGNGTATGTVVEIHRDKVTRTLQGSGITRNGSDEDPAYVIEEDGARVLKLRSEVERA